MVKRIYFLYVLVFLVLAAAIFLHRKSLMELDKGIDLVDNTHDVISSFEYLSGDLQTAEIHAESFVNSERDHLLAGDYLDLITDMNQLKQLVADPIQQRRLDTLSAAVDNWRLSLASTTAADTSNPVLQSKVTNDAFVIQTIIRRSIIRQKSLLAERQTQLKTIVKALNRWTIVLIAMAFVLVVFTTYYGYKQMKNRIDLEVLLESILNASQEGLITCKTCREGFKIEDFEILFANSAVKTHFGQEPAELIGKSILYLMPEIRTSGLFARWIQVVEDGLPDEYEASHKDEITGKDNWYSIKLVKLEDGVTVSFHNITELKSYKQNIVLS